MKREPIFDMLVDVCKRRQEDGALFGWEVRVTRKNSYQELLYPDGTGGKENLLVPQTIRFPVAETDYTLTVYVRHGEPVVMGNATLTLYPDSDMEAQVNDAIAAATAIRNKPWELVRPSSVSRRPKVRLLDPKIKNDPAGAAKYIRQRANDCFTGCKGSLSVNYGELFLDMYEIRTVTGTGMDYTRETSSVYFEAAAEKLPLPNTQEVHRNAGAISLAGCDVGTFCEKLSEEVFALGDTTLPETNGSVVLLVDADTVSAILHCLLAQLDAAMEYAKKPYLAEGAAIYGGELAPDSETLTLALDPFLDYMAESTPYTPEGLVPIRGTVIEGSRVRSRKVSNRMSQYLGIGVNPVMGNIVIGPGSKSFDELVRSADRVIEVKSFSSLLLNSDYLTYSSEIKLAREYDNVKGTTRLLKGGVLSGNIKENFSSFLSSRELAVFNAVDDGFSGSEGYCGPKYMLFRKGVAISGTGDRG